MTIVLDPVKVRAVFEEMRAEIQRLTNDLVMERWRNRRLLAERDAAQAELERARSIHGGLYGMGFGRQREQIRELEEQLETVTQERDDACIRESAVEQEHEELKERAKDVQGRIDQRDETIASLLDEQARLRRRIAELAEEDGEGSEEIPRSERRSVMVAQAAYARACKRDLSKRHKLAALREAKESIGELPEHMQGDLDDLERDEEQGEDMNERAW